MFVVALAACSAPPVTATGGSRQVATLPSFAAVTAGGPRAATPLLYPAYSLSAPQQSGFGYTLAGGDTNDDGLSDLLVGAPFGSGYEGRADVYLGDPAGPSSPASWSATGFDGEVELGGSSAACDVDGDGFDEVAFGTLEGEHVMVYAGSPSGPSDATRIEDPDEGGFYVEDSGDTGRSWIGGWHGFGWAVACGDVDADGYADLFVGAPYAGPDDDGVVRMYRGGPAGVATTASWTVQGPGEDHGWGTTLAWLGDVDGDGFGDLAIGTGEYSLGPMAVFHGGAGGPDTVADWLLDLAPPTLALVGTVTATSPGTTTTSTTTGPDTGEDEEWDTGEDEEVDPRPRMGERVAAAGDVNADGFMDLLVGAPEHDDEEGIALLYLGSEDGLEPVSAWRLDAVDEVYLGFDVAGLGDLDGDGFDEIGVTAPLAGGYVGATYVYRGAADGAEATAAFTLPGAGYYGFTYDLDDVGDLDGDGFAEVAFGLAAMGEVRIFTAAAPVEEPQDTGTPPEDTGTIPPPEPDTDQPDTDEPAAAPDEKTGGCGCASGGPGGALALVPLLLLVRRRG